MSGTFLKLLGHNEREEMIHLSCSKLSLNSSSYLLSTVLICLLEEVKWPG